MSESSEDIKRWTARRKASAVMDVIKGKTTAAELARSHDLTVAEVEQWMDDQSLNYKTPNQYHQNLCKSAA